MLIFNYLKKKNNRISKFYNDYQTLSPIKKVLWWILFINWIPMCISLFLLLLSAILWNFIECGTFFYISLGITIVVYLPWIASGFINSIKEKKDKK